MPNDNIHEEIESWLAADLHQQLHPDERASLHQHLAGCADCRRARDEYAEAATLLALALPPVAPPGGVRDRVVESTDGGNVVDIASRRAMNRSNNCQSVRPAIEPPSKSDSICRAIDELYARFGFDEVRVELSTRPEKSIGSDEQWERAGPRTVGHEHADATAVRVDARQLRGDELLDLGFGQDAVRAADACRGEVPGFCGGHQILAGRLCRAQSNEMRCDSNFDSTLGSSTSIMKSPSYPAGMASSEVRYKA